MKKIVSFSLLFVAILTINAQQKAKEYYYNIDDEVISKKEYDAIDEQLFNKLIVENDTAIIGTLKYKTSEGTLNPNFKQNFLRLLKQTVGSTIDTNKTLIIHFYSKGCDEEITSEVNNKKYFETLEKFPQVEAYFFTEREYRFKSDKKEIYEDRFTFLTGIFPDKVNCANYLILKPNGDYTIMYGKYELDQVLNHIKE